MNKNQRKIDVEELVKGLDITPTMYQNAIEKYHNVGKYLQDNGMNVDIFPQGSFCLGTVVRPYKNGEDKSYDLDFICVNNVNKSGTSPKIEKYLPHDILIQNEIYKNLLSDKEYDKCWTLEYAKVSDVDFNMDIVPAIPEGRNEIYELQLQGLEIEYTNNVIAITNKNNNSYNWVTSNPKAYKEWFDKINAPFLEFNRQERKNRIYNENRNLFASIEEIPKDIERSSLQRVIQILKRHRDVYFSKRNKENDKPISAIITTISAKIARGAYEDLGIVELLQYIVNEFQIYSKKQNMEHILFEYTYGQRNVINFNNGKWEIKNPVNPKDNLADSWNNKENPERAKLFFEWTKQLKNDFIDAFDLKDDEFFASLENGFGSNYVQRKISKSKYNVKNPIPIGITSTHKHWRNCEK
ncbi:hypothetical protein DSECCO2_526400 [anaerobic digester metagenome]|jgi:hypothetical protein|nr:nucleotidyltransferase [Bacillota bacterium]